MINFTGGMLKIGNKYVATQNIESIGVDERTVANPIGPDKRTSTTYINLNSHNSSPMLTRIAPKKIAEAYIEADTNNKIIDCNA